MSGCFGNHPEDRAREAELNRYLDELSKDDEMNNLVEDMMHQSTHDSALFRTYDDDYEVIDRDQVMRCLANLDYAIKGYNLIWSEAAQKLGTSAPEKLDKFSRPIDAIFTALSIMQKNLQKAVESEAEQVIESKREMACFGGKE